MRSRAPTTIGTVSRRRWVGMMVVMPPLSTGYEANDGIVATVVGRLIVPVSPNMGDTPPDAVQTRRDVSRLSLASVSEKALYDRRRLSRLGHHE